MARYLRLVLLLFFATGAYAQSFEAVGLQETYRGVIGETVKVPLKFRNTTDKPITLIIRRVSSQIGSTQKNYFCPDNTCLDHRTDDIAIKIDANEVINTLQVALDAGLAQGVSAVKYIAFNKAMPADMFEFDLNFFIDEKGEKQHIYSSANISLYDVYPNPVTEDAFVDYRILDDRSKVKIVIHNILGNRIEEYPLPATESKVKIRTESLNAGIYFYTLYVDNEGVITRKLIVKK